MIEQEIMEELVTFIDYLDTNPSGDDLEKTLLALKNPVPALAATVSLLVQNRLKHQQVLKEIMLSLNYTLHIEDCTMCQMHGALNCEEAKLMREKLQSMPVLL